MSLLSLACAGLLAVVPVDAEPDGSDLKTYDAVKNQAGVDSNAQVKLALWCEARGLQPERLKHLALAVLRDPANVTARGLLGLVSYQGRWENPDKVKDRIKDDEVLTARLAQYNSRRAELEELLARTGRRKPSRGEAARAHVNLGIWCESAGLKGEATAHFTSAVVLDPYKDAHWKHLGYVKHDGRWMSPEQAASESKDLDAQRKANKTWEPTLRKWRAWLADSQKRDETLGLFADVKDPRAVPSIVRVFFGKNESDQQLAVQLLSQIDAPASTRRLAEAAVLSGSERVRTAATRALAKREPRDYAGTLVDMIQSPMTYRVQPVAGPGSSGALLVETPAYRVLRTYEAPPAVGFAPNFRGYVGYDANGLPVAARGRELDKMAMETPDLVARDLAAIEARTADLIAQANVKAMDSQQRLYADVNEIEATNAHTAMTNGRIAPVLAETLNAPVAELKDDETAWHVWWNDKIGYKYDPPEQVQLALNASPQYPPPKLMSCFVAGTPVRTLQGHRAIESLIAGDQVLTQNVETGELSFQSVQVVHHNPPNATIRLKLDNGETLEPSIYHRFWRAGKGWILARDMKAGDVLRTLSGLSKVVSATPGPAVPLFNLDVAQTRTFFVGEHDTLVHDNTLPDPKTTPFDAEPDLASLGRPVK